ncbi:MULTISPECIES: helicase associated domain-containing protein [unclassified Streptomyces]|uniref:helicase associated domain-containing protein n=1 Tax=unclassified Streptomyces TaxID=2593676 RepID=UPI00332280B1
MDSVLRVVPVAGETTWSFVHRVAAAYRLRAGDLLAVWQWGNRGHRARGSRPDGEVLLDETAREQLAGWCRVPVEHLAWALPSLASRPPAYARGCAGQGRGRATWRAGSGEWGPVAFGCRLCAARRGGGGPVWVYRARWGRLCAYHGRWLLDVGGGHPLEFVDVGFLTDELGRAQARWGRVARAAVAAGAGPGEVFALARAVVCGWWEREEFGERDAVWGLRLEQAAARTRRRYAEPEGWGERQWRLLVRDAVVFPEVVAVAGALMDPRVQQMAVRDGAGGLARGLGGGQQLTAVLGEPVGRVLLRGLEEDTSPGPLASWVRAVVREQNRPAASVPRAGRYGLWWVRSAHRPVEVETGLRVLAELSAAGAGRSGSKDGSWAGAGGSAARDGWQAELAVPRRAGHGRGAEQWCARLFTEGLEQARLQVEKTGHLAVAHAARQRQEGFDLGRWLANRRAEAASLTVEQHRALEELDAWWNPPWPIGWQRAFYRARAHVLEHGPVHGRDNLAGLPRRLERWLRHQITGYDQLHARQRHLLAELGLTRAEIEHFWAWSARRRPMADGLSRARAWAARHGHLAVSRPTTVDGFALGSWLNSARRRQGDGASTSLGRQLTAVDAWWNPAWPVAWQRMWWTSRYHLDGLPAGCTWWPGAAGADQATAWLAEQAAHRSLLHPGQQHLIDDLVARAGHVPAWQPRISDTAWQILSALLPALPQLVL